MKEDAKEEILTSQGLCPVTFHSDLISCLRQRRLPAALVTVKAGFQARETW